MKKDIILAGVGGQGILSIATVIGQAALEAGLYIKQAEVHGMSQRGGDVQSHLRISSEPIWSDLIPQGEADMILSLEPLEALRYTAWLSPIGYIVSATPPIVNIDNYPDIEDVYAAIENFAYHLLVDTPTLLKAVDAPAQAANMLLLGAAVPLLNMEYAQIEHGVRKVFASKASTIVDANCRAVRAGYDYAMQHQA